MVVCLRVSQRCSKGVLRCRHEGLNITDAEAELEPANLAVVLCRFVAPEPVRPSCIEPSERYEGTGGPGNIELKQRMPAVIVTTTL